MNNYWPSTEIDLSEGFLQILSMYCTITKVFANKNFLVKIRISLHEMEVKSNLCSLNLVLRFATEVYNHEILTKENIEKS